MNQSESANIIELLRNLNWNGEQIADFQLAIEGRISIEEATSRIKEAEGKTLQ